MASRDDLLNQPRSGARALGGSPGPSASRSSARSAPPTRSPRPRPVPASSTLSSRAVAQRRAAASASSSRPAATPAPASQAPSRRSRGPSTRDVTQFTAPEFREYQGIILAEFVLAELLVAATPIATRQNTPGLSPYIGRDMVKMLSIGLVYFLLELTAVAGGKSARFGAWFGGLILIVVGLNEGANVAKVFNLFGIGLAKASGATSTGSTTLPDVGLANQSTVQGVINAATNPPLLSGTTQGATANA